MKILVTGGAGYIGSHTVRMLLERGHDVIVIDNLEKGFKEALPPFVEFYQASLSDEMVLNNIFSKHKIDVVLHFADYTEIEMSMKYPTLFFKNNVSEGFSLLKCMKDHKVNKIIFSSSASVYKTSNQPIPEDFPKKPNNIYGISKHIFEQILKSFEHFGINSISLRYFNACGAAYGIGESHRPETHLIPIILQVALGQRDKIKIFGNDYPTHDGTCIRDYIHVIDLAQAHILAMDALCNGKTGAYNVGLGKGYSVKEIIETCREVTGHQIPTEVAPRRAGDPPALVASSEKIRNELGWTPKYTNIKEIIKSAWEWHKNNPEGYKK